MNNNNPETRILTIEIKGTNEREVAMALTDIADLREGELSIHKPSNYHPQEGSFMCSRPDPLPGLPNNSMPVFLVRRDTSFNYRMHRGGNEVDVTPRGVKYGDQYTLYLYDPRIDPAIVDRLEGQVRQIQAEDKRSRFENSLVGRLAAGIGFIRSKMSPNCDF